MDWAYGYDATIQFAFPGPDSRPRSLLNARPPAIVTAFETNWVICQYMIENDYALQLNID